MSQKDNNLPFPNYLMDEAQSTFATPELTRVLNLARHEPKERPDIDMKDMIEQRFSEGRGILPIDTRDSDALLAQKVRRALEMANGQRVAIIQWNAPEELSAADNQTPPHHKADLQNVRIFRDLLQGATVEELAGTYQRDDLEHGQIIERGLQLINEVQGLHLDQLAMEGSLQASYGVNMWLMRAEQAIQTLKLQPDMTRHTRGGTND